MPYTSLFVTVELKKAESVIPDGVIDAGGYAVGSPLHFSIMSSRILTLLTNLYSICHKMAGKSMGQYPPQEVEVK